MRAELDPLEVQHIGYRVVAGGKCPNCKAKLALTGHHLDHITPLSRGGLNVDGNVQLLCPPCNLTKAAKDPIEWAQQNGRLL